MNRSDVSGLRGLLSRKTAIVTGAGGGVGEGIAEALAEAGASVVLAVRRLETGELVADRINRAGGIARAVQCDVGIRVDVERTVDAAVSTFGRLDLVVHNALAPVGPPTAAEQVSDELWQGMMRTGLRASFFIARSAYPHLRSTGGSIVFLVSQQGMEGSHAFPAYAAVKSGQRGLARSLAREWGPSGVRVNCLAPLGVTPALETAYENDPGLRARLESRVSLRRVGDPARDIGPAVAFLGSDLARYVTGQTLVVDGGGFML